MCTLLRPRANCFISLGLLAVVTASLTLNAQTTAAAKPAGSGASGFSIETEMLTYRALESNGEAIACDVAAYLYGTKPDFKSLPTGAICNVGSVSGPSTVGVIVLPFDRSAFADFQIWRSDMQTMAEFQKRGADACAVPKAAATTTPGQPEAPRGRGLTTTPATTAAAVGGVMGAMTPAGAMLGTGAGILGLFAQNQDSSPVGGTIEDQAFMDNVSRELRDVNVSVMMPTVYSPFELTSVDAAHSPFVTALDKLLHIRDCIVANKSSTDPDVKSIDEFLAALAGNTTPAKSTAPTSASAGSSTSSSSDTSSGSSSSGSSKSPSGGTSTSTTQPAPPARSHLEAVLTADGLAQRLGADPATGRIPETAPQHLLLVKALESGGSVSKSSNIFGTKMSYSGGSVGTYALFNLSGDLECSGNVYDYAGYLQAKQFQKQLRAYVPDPAHQVIFQRGTCRKP
jgi:hypothetical protein